jgi:hypothetical protein
MQYDHLMGRLVYFEDLYYTIGGSITVSSGGTGYTGNAEVTIDSPETDWGIPATAVAEVKDGSVISVEMVSSGRGYSSTPPTVTFSSPDVGINTATGSVNLIPTYYVIESSTSVSSGICTIVLLLIMFHMLLVLVTSAPFFKQSRVLASGHSLRIYWIWNKYCNSSSPKWWSSNSR